MMLGRRMMPGRRMMLGRRMMPGRYRTTHELAAAGVRLVISWLSPSEAATRSVVRALTAVHLAIYRLTGGRLTADLGLPSGGMILLTTTGRKTGEPRTVPLLAVRRGDDWLITPSNAGLKHPPGWWFNLRADPAAMVQAGRETTAMTATVADETTRAELWPLFLRVYPGYADHEQRTTRKIPVVILRPAEAHPRSNSLFLSRTPRGISIPARS